MGWTTTCDYRGGGIKNYLDRRFACDDARYPKFEILDSVLHGRTEYYAAVRRTARDTGNVVVFALVALVSYRPRDPEGYTLGWKDMCDSMGPTICNCPRRIIDLLDPPFNEYSRDWRQRCLAKADSAVRMKSLLVNGTIVEMVDPLTFTNGATHQRFTVIKRGRKIRYRASDGMLCRISKMAQRDWRIVDPGDEEPVRTRTDPAGGG